MLPLRPSVSLRLVHAREELSSLEREDRLSNHESGLIDLKNKMNDSFEVTTLFSKSKEEEDSLLLLLQQRKEEEEGRFHPQDDPAFMIAQGSFNRLTAASPIRNNDKHDKRHDKNELFVWPKYDLFTIGKGSMNHLYKYKSHDHHAGLFQRYHARPVKLATRPLYIPGPGTLSPDMIGKLVMIKHNKTISGDNDNTTTTTTTDGFHTFLNWANASNPRNISLVNPAMDQGNNCGSCWAMVATGSMEAAVALAHPDIAFAKIRLSVQELIDCDVHSLDEGCQGGNPLLAMDFLHRYGLTSWHRYPYTGEPGKCQGGGEITMRSNAIAKVQAWGMIPPHKEHVMKLAVRYLGPVAVSFRATHPDFLNYESGIFDVSHCGEGDSTREATDDHDDLLDESKPMRSGSNNHALLITGYGEETKHDKTFHTNGTTTFTTKRIKYWIARNSWGEDWGEQGFVRIRRGKNICGLAQNPSVALGGIYLKTDAKHAILGGPAAAIRLGAVAVGIAVLTFVLLVAASLRCCRKRRRLKRQRPRVHLSTQDHANYGTNDATI